jgi:hypothetical protein
MSEYEWERCTVSQWEKKAELSMRERNMSDALKFADLANCREMDDNGVPKEEIANRFDIEQ